MKVYKLIFACIGLALGIADVCGQTVYNEIRPSVNAQQFLSAASGDNSLHTGELSVNIPLFNLQAKGVNVPISISFNGGGITHESEASNIGLGWSLLAGGVITQTIRDKKDQQTTSSIYIPWRYDRDFLQNKRYEEQIDISNSNKFDMAMDAVMGSDGEPDFFSYAFLGYFGDICFKYDSNTFSGTLYPDKSFKIEETTDGFKVIGNDGVVYLFEVQETKDDNATSWFLTEIKTLQGGNVTFHYTDDKSYDLARKLGASSYPLVVSKRLTRIDYDYGYVVFRSAEREDMYFHGDSTDSRRITNIELYSAEGLLIDGYEFGDNSYALNEPREGSDPWYTKRLILNSLRAYNSNGEYLPPYEFEYDYHFGLTKNSIRDNPFPESTAHNTWAHYPGQIAVVDRDFDGSLTPVGDSIQGGMELVIDPIDGLTVHDFFTLTKMTFPTGGTESYYYESHDFSFIGTSLDTAIVPSYYSRIDINGKRLWKKVITDGNGNSQIVEYKYCLHDEEYNQIDDNYFNGPRLFSSGVLANPSIHTSTIYKPVYNEYDGDDEPRLLASRHFTQKPQNSMVGSAVYYLEVEEIFKSESGSVNGKKVHYYKRISALPATNYIYLNYRILDDELSARDNILIGLPNTLHGRQEYPAENSSYGDYYYSYLAYPLGRFYQSSIMKGRILKEVTLNADGDIVRKIQNEYASAPEESLYGLLVQRFDDTADYPFPDGQSFRYLISQTVSRFGVSELIGRTITNYYSEDSLTQKQTYTYTNLNLLKSTSASQSTGENVLEENVYPTDIDFQTQSNLSREASAIQIMKNVNMIGVPIQRTVKKGTEYIQGDYTAYRQLSNGAIVIDTIFILGDHLGTSVHDPVINTNGKLARSNQFIRDNAYVSYDENANPTTVVSKGGVAETIVWGHGGLYTIAKITNYTYGALESDSALVSQLGLLDDYTVITEFNRTNLTICNQAIRNSLPENVMVTTYTYDPLKGITSETDPNGVSTYYEYDSFSRLKAVRDQHWQIIKAFKYHYAGSN